FAVRTPHATRYFDGLPDLPLGGLDDDAARALLVRTVQGRMDTQVRERIIAETGGNPLALLELPQQMSAAELAGGFELPVPAALPNRIQDQYARRVDALPKATRRLILLAAADPVGDATLIWRGAHNKTNTNEALGRATDAG